jgi:hypothetical protein
MRGVCGWSSVLLCFYLVFTLYYRIHEFHDICVMRCDVAMF